MLILHLTLSTTLRHWGNQLNNQVDEEPIEEITVEQLHQIMDQGIVLIDVREEYEFNEVRADGAKLLPLDQVPATTELLPRDKTIFIICASGNRSMVACEYLRSQGFTTTNIIGGTIAWNLAGYKVSTGSATEVELFGNS